MLWKCVTSLHRAAAPRSVSEIASSFIFVQFIQGADVTEEKTWILDPYDTSNSLSLSLLVNAQPNIAVIIVPIIFAIIIAGIIGAAYVLVKKR